MNIKLIKLLGIACALFVAIILCEWLYAVFAQKQLLTSMQAVDKKKNMVAQLPTIELSKRQETSYDDLVNRPLFLPGRKPVAEPADNAAKPTTPAATETFNWSLNGVYTHKQTLYALFSRTNTKVAKDNFRKITKDNDIDGWKLTEIHKDKVVMSQGDKQKELTLMKVKPKTLGLNSPANPMMGQPNIPVAPGQPGLISSQHPPVSMPMPDPSMEPIQPVEPEQIIEPDPMMEPEFIPEADPTLPENSQDELYQ